MVSINIKYEANREKIEEHQTTIKINIQESTEILIRFSFEKIKDGKLREEYNQMAEKVSEEIFEEATAKAKSTPSKQEQIWEEAAKMSRKFLDFIVDITKDIKVGFEFLKMLKKEALNYPQLLEKFTATLFPRAGAYNALESIQQWNVLETIYKATGGTIQKIKFLSHWFRRVGTPLIIITIGISVYVICESVNPCLEAVKQAVTLGFGVVGGCAGAKLGAAVGVVGGPIGVLIGAIIGGCAGSFLSAFGGASLVDVLYRAFFPSALGPGPPPLDVLPVLYGQPALGVTPLVRLQINEAAVAPIELGVNPVLGLPALWPN